jgi:hypothetical protein
MISPIDQSEIDDIFYSSERETDMQQIIKNGTKAVSIYSNSEAGPFTARLYVNCEAGQLGDATLTVARRKSLAAAKAWAEAAVGR